MKNSLKILFENAHILVNHWKSNQFQQCKKWMKKSQKNQCFSFISKYFLKNEISLKYGVFQTFYKNNMWKSAVLCRIWLVMFAKTSEVWWKRKKQAFFSTVIFSSEKNKEFILTIDKVFTNLLTTLYSLHSSPLYWAVPQLLQESGQKGEAYIRLFVTLSCTYLRNNIKWLEQSSKDILQPVGVALE